MFNNSKSLTNNSSSSQPTFNFASQDGMDCSIEQTPPANIENFSINLTPNYIRNNLFFAITQGYNNCVEGILQGGVSEEIKNSSLCYAAEIGNISILKLLLSFKANINSKTTHFPCNTPLHSAAINQNPELIRFLLTNNADANAHNWHGKTPAETLLGAKSDDERTQECLIILGNTNVENIVNNFDQMHLSE